MPVYQGSFKSILGGVSQQVYTDRQLSQVEEQINMTSDAVRGLRKRPGTRLTQIANTTSNVWWSRGNYGHLRHFVTDLGWGITSFVVNTITGYVTAFVEDHTIQHIGQSDYLVASNPSDIVFTTVGSTMFVGNTSVKPTLEMNETRLDPARQGYFFVLSGAYGKKFEVRIETSGGAYAAVYTTPDADATNAAKESTPEYIIGQLESQLTAQIGGATGLSVVQTTGAYMYLRIDEGYGSLTVTTNTGQSYAVASNLHTVDSTDDLPARLPAQAGGFVMTVGDETFAQYFQWSYADSRWIEKGAYGSPTGITASTMPLVFTATATENQHTFSTTTWPGRLAGDDNSNAVPAFADDSLTGITGLSSFQGRLIIFSGSYISMSNSRRDRRTDFWRNTVTQSLDTDRIEITSTSFTGASFKYGVPYNSDLILASEEHQGVIPGRNQIITPSTATALLTSTYQMDMGLSPQASGRSLYFTYPRSNSSFSVKEMLPSGYTDLQYVSQDVTDHLPTYLEGAARYMAASTTNNIVTFGSTTEQGSLFVNEYLWSGDNKVLSAWHRWDFDGIVHCAWFVREVLCLLVERDSNMMFLTLSLRDSPDPTDPARFLPAMDYCTLMPVVDATTDSAYIQFTQGDETHDALWTLVANQYHADDDTFVGIGTAVPDGDYIGSEVGILSIDGTNRRLYLQPTYGSDTLWLGLRFTARFSPTPPRMFNGGGDYTDLDKMVILFYNIHTRYTSPFTVTAIDRGGYSSDQLGQSVISYDSSELGLLAAPLAKRYNLRVRVGLEVESSQFILESNTLGDMNIQGLGYHVKFYNKVRRI